MSKVFCELTIYEYEDGDSLDDVGQILLHERYYSFPQAIRKAYKFLIDKARRDPDSLAWTDIVVTGLDETENWIWNCRNLHQEYD